MPQFDLADSGGLVLILLRGLVDWAILAVFGTQVLRLMILPAALSQLPPDAAVCLSRRLRHAVQILASVAVVLLVLWLAGVAQSLSEADDWAGLLRAIRTVLGSTSFGAVVIAQLAGLCILAAVLAQNSIFADILATLAAFAVIALEAAHGHAFSMGDAGLYLSTALHLAASGAWLGSLPWLFWLAWRLPAGAANALLRAFSPLGQIAVLLIAVTAMLQGFAMIQTMQSLVGTAYGWTALLKLLLFGLLLIFACFNRFWGNARLAQGKAKPILISLVLENAFGLAIVLAAGLLASLPPIMRM